MNTAELIALAERVEKATSQDTDLFAAAYRAIMPGDGLAWYRAGWRHVENGAHLEAVTALIAEKLPGASWQCGFVHPDQADSDNQPGAWARVFPPWSWLSEDDDGEGIIVSAETPTLALLSAALRALAQAPSTGGQENG